MISSGAMAIGGGVLVLLKAHATLTGASVITIRQVDGGAVDDLLGDVFGKANELLYVGDIADSGQEVVET